MPYSPEHRRRTNERIVRSVQVLFNRHGFEGVSIDAVMAHAGLTRGGFYHHFKSKCDLYAAAIEYALAQAPIFRANCRPDEAIRAYLSSEHFDGIDGSCSLAALPSYVARSGLEVKLAFEAVFKRMVELFEADVAPSDGGPDRAMAIAAMCVGAMVIARGVQDRHLADSLRHAATSFALRLAGCSPGLETHGAAKDEKRMPIRRERHRDDL